MYSILAMCHKGDFSHNIESVPKVSHLWGQNGLFVELDLKTYVCSRQSASLQRNRL